MKNLEIENCLKEWCENMLAKFPTIALFYEYSEKRNVYLVNAMVNLCDAVYDEFCIQTMAFEDEMNGRFNIEAPLFTENSELFSLSKEAVCFRREYNSVEYKYATFIEPLNHLDFQYHWKPYNAQSIESATQKYICATTAVAIAA